MVCHNFILPEFCKPRLSLCSVQFAQLILPYFTTTLFAKSDTSVLNTEWMCRFSMKAKVKFGESVMSDLQNFLIHYWQDFLSGNAKILPWILLSVYTGVPESLGHVIFSPLLFSHTSHALS